MSLPVPDLLVLAILGEQSSHGWAVAQLTARDGELGRIWHVPKAIIYRSIGRLLEVGLIEPLGTERGPGPERTVYRVRPAGRAAARRWLNAPVGHVRDFRSELLLKLALLDRRGDNPAGLLTRQRMVLEPIVRALQAASARDGEFDAVLLAWRKASALAALDFLDTISSAAARRFGAAD
jgi:DNA-binding PadR family transcriptional regulator